MKPRTFLFVVICVVGIIIMRHVGMTADDRQYARIDAFYAAVKSNPSAFPKEIHVVVNYIDKARESGTISREKPQLESTDEPKIQAMLRKQVTPQQIEARETWRKATRELMYSLHYDRDFLHMDYDGKMAERYGYYVRDYLSSPIVAMHNGEFYVVTKK